MTMPAAPPVVVQGLPHPEELTCAARSLVGQGFVHLWAPWPGWSEARHDSLRLIAAARAGDQIGQGLPGLGVVGEFVSPPSGSLRRDYQVLHIDFGLPIAGDEPVDSARFTVLHMDADQQGSGSVTRIVGLRSLLSQRSWPDRSEIATRLGLAARPDRPVEGILGRIVETVDRGTVLPPVTTPGMLCGMEFSSYEDEESYFWSHGMDVSKVEWRIVLRPQETLVIDNLRVAHGRIGRRNENELHQLFVGYRSLAGEGQRVLLDRILQVFDAP
jgi:hypothetical protein